MVDRGLLGFFVILRVQSERPRSPIAISPLQRSPLQRSPPWSGVTQLTSKRIQLLRRSDGCSHCDGWYQPSCWDADAGRCPQVNLDPITYYLHEVWGPHNIPKTVGYRNAIHKPSDVHVWLVTYDWNQMWDCLGNKSHVCCVDYNTRKSGYLFGHPTEVIAISPGWTHKFMHTHKFNEWALHQIAEHVDIVNTCMQYIM